MQCESDARKTATMEKLSAAEEQKAVEPTINDVLPAIDKDKERRLVRKLDVRIVPMVMLLYLLSFLDR